MKQCPRLCHAALFRHRSWPLLTLAIVETINGLPVLADAIDMPRRARSVAIASSFRPEPRAMTRTRPPNRRLAENFELQASGLQYTCTVRRFPDGRLAEIFLTTTKQDHTPTPARAMLPSNSRSRFSTAPTPKPFAVRPVAILMARRTVRSASHSISSSVRKDRQLVG